MRDGLIDSLALSPRQIQAIVESDARVNILTGSIRSGKTTASLVRWLIYVADAPTGGALVVIGRTRDSVARNVFGPLQDPSLFGPLADMSSYTAGAPTGVILGRTVYILGASDAKAEKVLRGLTVAGAYVDEATVVPEEFFTQLLGRMSVPGAQLFATTNPDNPAHWLKRRFLDRAEKIHWRVFHFTLRDNPALTPEYVAAVTAEFTGLWFRRFILGEWVAAEGAVYDMWDPGRHVVSWGSLPAMDRLVGVGVDYGTTNATAALLLGVAERKLWLIDEWRHDPAQTNTRKTDGQLSAGIRDWLAGPHLPYPPGMTEPRIEWVAVDPAAASLKLQLHADGVVNVTDADNDVAYGIRTVASLLASDRLKVTEKCAGWIVEAPGYSWDEKATLKGEDKPIKVADHSLDAGRYAIATTEALWRGHLTEEAVAA